MTPKTIGLLIDVAIGLVVIVLVIYFGKGLIGLVQAPAHLEAAIGNNEAFKAGAESQNKATEARKKEAERRKAASTKAVAEAGKQSEQRAREILKAPSEGSTDCERAINRIDRELALR